MHAPRLAIADPPSPPYPTQLQAEILAAAGAAAQPTDDADFDQLAGVSSAVVAEGVASAVHMCETASFIRATIAAAVAQIATLDLTVESGFGMQHAPAHTPFVLSPRRADAEAFGVLPGAFRIRSVPAPSRAHRMAAF